MLQRDPDAERHEEGRLHARTSRSRRPCRPSASRPSPRRRSPRRRPGSGARPDAGRRPRTHRTSTAIAGGISQRVADRLERRRQHEPAGEGEEAAEQHAQTVADGPMGRIERLQRCGRNRGASDQHATRLADERAKLSTAPGSLPHPAPAGRRRPVDGRWAPLAPRAPRSSPLCRRRHPRAAQADPGTLPPRRGGVNTSLTCDDARIRRSTDRRPDETRPTNLCARRRVGA